MSHQKFFIIITIMLFGVVSWGKADPINYGLKAEERTGREFDEFWVNDTGDSFIYRHHPYYDERDSKLWNVNGTFVNIDRVSGKYFHPSLYSFFSFSGFKGDGNNFGNLIDTKSYEVLWKYKFPKNSHSEEVRVLHNVVVIYEGVSTKGFDLKTGAVLWEIEPIEGFDSVIHSNDRYLYVNSWDSEGGFKMFDPQNGKKLFSRTKVRQWWERGKYLFVIDRKDLGHLLKYEISNFNNKTSYPIDPRIRDPYRGSSATDSVVRGISPDGKYVILSGGIVVETEGWTKAAELPNFSDDLFEPVAFSANGNFLLSSYKGGSDSMVVYGSVRKFV